MIDDDCLVVKEKHQAAATLIESYVMIHDDYWEGTAYKQLLKNLSKLYKFKVKSIGPNPEHTGWLMYLK